MEVKQRRFSLTPFRDALVSIAIILWIGASVSHANSSPQINADGNSDAVQDVTGTDTSADKHSHNDVKGLPEPASQQGTGSTLDDKKHSHAEMKGHTTAETIADDGQSKIEKAHDHQKTKGTQR